MILLVFLWLPVTTAGQHQVKIRITPPSLPGMDSSSYFLSGSFNHWNPKDSQFVFGKREGRFELAFQYQEGDTLECKVTRGSWQSAEADTDGYPAPNRIYRVDKDTLLEFRIDGWTDLSVRKHTCSSGVMVMADSFPMHFLQDTRKIWVYLPPSYTHGKKRYPVIYMEDGQNLFDRATTAFGTEWKVDETLDSLARKGYPEYIVVGIASGEKRLQEYMPYPGSRIMNPVGGSYAKFVAEELVPWVDGHYRTLRDPKKRTTAGSSMGALISLYLLTGYPGIFGNAGIFSPAAWVVDPFSAMSCKNLLPGHRRIYIYAGTNEMSGLVEDVRNLSANLLSDCGASVQLDISPGGRHSEAYWQRPFRDFIAWLNK